jgi:hypothetical protein
VLITSHENALRGILMHLCGIPEEAMNQLHIPNGVPLVYNVKEKCITLLEDKEADEQVTIEDFGPAAKYLFQPCELDDDFFQKMEHVSVSSSRRDDSTKSTDSLDSAVSPFKLEEEIEFMQDGSNPSSHPSNSSTVTNLSK